MDGRKVLYIGVALIVAGLALMAASFATGGSKAGVFAIIPFFYSSSPIGGLGGLLLFIGIFVAIIGWWSRDAVIVSGDPYDAEPRGRRGGSPEDQYPPPGRDKDARGKTAKGKAGRGGGGPGGPAGGGRGAGRRVRGGAVVVVGPVPVVWGSDASMARTLMIIGGIITAVLIVFYLILYLG